MVMFVVTVARFIVDTTKKDSRYNIPEYRLNNAKWVRVFQFLF